MKFIVEESLNHSFGTLPKSLETLVTFSRISDLHIKSEFESPFFLYFESVKFKFFIHSVKSVMLFGFNLVLFKFEWKGFAICYQNIREGQIWLFELN